MRLISFRPVITGALRGYANVEWRAAGLIWLGVAIFVGADGKGWASLPAAPVIDAAGRHHIIDGKKQYRATTEWLDRARSDQFSAQVIALLLHKYPHALDARASDPLADDRPFQPFFASQLEGWVPP